MQQLLTTREQKNIFSTQGGRDDGERCLRVERRGTTEDQEKIYSAFFLIARSSSFFSSLLKLSSGPADKKPVVMKKARS